MTNYLWLVRSTSKLHVEFEADNRDDAIRKCVEKRMELVADGQPYAVHENDFYLNDQLFNLDEFREGEVVLGQSVKLDELTPEML